jgi:hypothetical protein
MKKLVILLMLLPILAACTIEENCNCSRVQNIYYDYYSIGYPTGRYQLQNICTGQIIQQSFRGTPPTQGTLICNTYN